MIIGIDLGTTNSLAAYFTPEGPKLIPNRLGEYLTPSVVAMGEDGQVFVGRTALERKMTRPDLVAEVFKRSMGTKKEYELGEKTFLSEELSSFVLRSLKEDAEVFLQCEIEEAVVSVPAYFNDEQRKATKRAGEMAGLKVERMISEPTAAAISYGLHEKKENTKFLVFDLGGGTFDVSVLELYHNFMEVRAVAGDNFLGGEDFTDVMVRSFLHKNGLKEDEQDKKTMAALYRQAEACKRDFSDKRTSTMRCRMGGETVEMEMGVDEFEKSCQILLTKIRKPIERSLKDANVRLADIDEVVLVGGATKLTLIRKFVGKLFGKLPNQSVNPDEAVALGAAIQGAMKERSEAIKEMILTDVCPFTLGTDVVVERQGNYMEPGHFFPIIERNTVIPVSRTERLYTAHDNQTAICVKVLQGESRLSRNNVYLGEVAVSVPPKKAGEEVIEVTYTYDVNAILEVEVTVASTGQKERIVLKKEGLDMSDEEVEARLLELASIKIHPRKEEENRLLLFRGERMYEEATGDLRREIGARLREFEEYLNKQDRHQIEGARRDLREFLDEVGE